MSFWHFLWEIVVIFVFVMFLVIFFRSSSICSAAATFPAGRRPAG